MKIYIAYALVVSGIPIFIGNILGIILSTPISLVIGLSRGGKETPLEVAKAGTESFKWSTSGKVEMDLRDRIAHICLDILIGLGTVFTAGLIFYFIFSNIEKDIYNYKYSTEPIAYHRTLLFTELLMEYLLLIFIYSNGYLLFKDKLKKLNIVCEDNIDS